MGVLLVQSVFGFTNLFWPLAAQLLPNKIGLLPTLVDPGASWDAQLHPTVPLLPQVRQREARGPTSKVRGQNFPF